MEFNGLFGKIVAELVAEGQADPSILKELLRTACRSPGAFTIALIERGKAAGEFSVDTDAELLVDAIVAQAYYGLLLRLEPLAEKYANALIDQVPP